MAIPYNRFGDFQSCENRSLARSSKLLRISKLSSSERGLTLFEASLALSLFGMFMTLVNLMVAANEDRRKAIVLGKDTAFITEAVQRYVGFEYDQLRENLVSSSQGNLLMAIEMAQIHTAGYLPSAVISGGTFRNSLGNKYTLFLRGVNSLDASSPQATLGKTEVDTDNDGLLDNHLVDGNKDNGEYELEAILVSSEGEVVEPHIGSPAVVDTEMFSAGYLQKGNIARGPLGVWEMNISPYQSLTAYPQEKQFVSLVALSRKGVFGFTEKIGNNETGLNTYLDRCVNTLGSVRADCKINNQIYTEVVFNSFDSDSDGRDDIFGMIRNLYQLEMGPPVDSDGDTIPDTFSFIKNVHGIGCQPNSPGTRENELVVDCPKVALTGDVEVTNDLSVQGQLTVAGKTKSQRFIAEVLNNQDLTKGIYHTSIIRLDGDTTVQKPVCKDPGSTPQIFVTPAAYSIHSGHAVVGIRGFATDMNNTWKVGLKALITSDDNNDGKSDKIDLKSTSDYVQVLTKCS